MTQTVLDKIKAYKLEEVADDKAATPLSVIEDRARAASPTRGFATSLIAAAKTGYGLIAEVKKASPSKGLIRPDFDPTAIAQAYQSGGAACFVGSNRYAQFPRGQILSDPSPRCHHPARITQRFHV